MRVTFIFDGTVNRILNCKFAKVSKYCRSGATIKSIIKSAVLQSIFYLIPHKNGGYQRQRIPRSLRLHLLYIPLKVKTCLPSTSRLFY